MGAYISYKSLLDQAEIRSYFAVPANTSAPAVIMLRGVAGPDDGYTKIADQLAGHGYAALVHKWQVRGNDPTDAQMLADIRGAIKFLKTHSGVDASRIAVFGYCKGGGMAVLAAAEFSELKAIVSFHGFARRTQPLDESHATNPIDVVDRLKRSVMILHGEADDVSPIGNMREMAEKMRAADCPVEFVAYPGAKHGFAVSTHAGYLASASDESFAKAVGFLSTCAR